MSAMAEAGGTGEPIDVVYTWVDGSDPEHRRQLAYWRARYPALAQESAGPHRFRNHDELRYSLRSVERHLPWIRNVYLVTNGQAPSWLDRRNPRLKLITHADIFVDPGHLPTFNSFAIEANLHRIPGLSANYLYFNDDLFVGRPLQPADFLAPETGHQVYLEGWPLPRRNTARSTTDLALAHTQDLLDRRFRPRERRGLAHVPVLYRSGIVEALQREWGAELRATSAHRFRSADDVALHVLYTYFIVEAQQERYFPVHLKADWSSVSAFVMMTADTRALRQALAAIARERPKFFCINDDLITPWPWVTASANRLLDAFLTRYFPEPSEFELPAK